MINYNGKKDCDSNHMLIIWSIIGLKWAAYVTIPFIIILFKWTNYMMWSPAEKISKFFNLFLTCCSLQCYFNWLAEQLITLCIRRLILVVYVTADTKSSSAVNTRGLPVLPSCHPNNLFLIYPLPVHYCICKQMSAKRHVHHKLRCINTFSPHHLKVESNQCWRALYLIYNTCCFS